MFSSFSFGLGEFWQGLGAVAFSAAISDCLAAAKSLFLLSISSCIERIFWTSASYPEEVAEEEVEDSGSGAVAFLLATSAISK